MKIFGVGTSWAIYEGDVPQIHTIVRHEQFDNMHFVITECGGQQTQWLPSVLEWLVEPELKSIDQPAYSNGQ